MGLFTFWKKREESKASLSPALSSQKNDQSAEPHDPNKREFLKKAAIGSAGVAGLLFASKNASALQNVFISGDATGQNVGVALTAAPGADTLATGITCLFTAGEALVFGDVCYINSSGNLVKADADSTSTAPVVAMALGTISNAATGNFLLYGIVRNDAWNWTVGGAIYLSTTVGALTQTAPSGTDDVVQKVGHATHADRMLFNPSVDYITAT